MGTHIEGLETRCSPDLNTLPKKTPAKRLKTRFQSAGGEPSAKASPAVLAVEVTILNSEGQTKTKLAHRVRGIVDTGWWANR